MTTVGKTRAVKRKTRAVKREVRTLLRALRMVGNPGVEASPNLSPYPDRAAPLAYAWRREAALSMAVAAVRRLQTRVPEVRPLLMAKEPMYLDKRVTRMLEGWLRRYLPQRSDAITGLWKIGIIGLWNIMTPRTPVGSFGARTWPELIMRLEQGVRESQVAIRVLYGHMRPGVPPNILMMHSQGHTTYWIEIENAQTGGLICEKTDGSTFWLVVLLVLIGSFLAWAIEEAVTEGWFNETDDDDARAEINELNCKQIAAKDNSHWISLFNAMINGPTGDEDEAAMFKVLDCLPCDRVQAIVANWGVQDLMDEFQGSEWDKLVVRLQACGLLSFHDWDDDATCEFIKNTTDYKLAQLSINDIVTLCKNLFDGSTGDDDEACIIRLMKVQDPCKVQNILVHHISMEDFDDEVDGDEWDELSQILIAALPPFTICP